MKLPAGKYFVGDPCYVFNDGWSRLLHEADFFEDDAIVTFNGHNLFATHTAYGDGLYSDQNGHMYPVDSGLIGAVPSALWERDAGDKAGMIVVFDSDLEVGHGSKHWGFIRIGDILIDTVQDGDGDEQ